MRICTDGFIALENKKYVRTPGRPGDDTPPLPQEEAINFLLTHAFPGARKITRPLSVEERRQVRLAVWAESVNERMELLDSVWRSITKAVPVDETRRDADLLQVAYFGDRWAFPLYFVDGTTRVRPQGGIPVSELNGQGKAERIELA